MMKASSSRRERVDRGPVSTYLGAIFLHNDVLRLPVSAPPRHSYRGGSIGVEDDPPLNTEVDDQALHTESLARGPVEGIQAKPLRAERYRLLRARPVLQCHARRPKDPAG